MPPLEALVINGAYFNKVRQKDMWDKMEEDLKRLQPGDVILVDRAGGNYSLFKEARQYLAGRAIAAGYFLRFADPIDLNWAQRAVGGRLQYIPDKDAYTILFDKDGSAQRPKRKNDPK